MLGFADEINCTSNRLNAIKNESYDSTADSFFWFEVDIKSVDMCVCVSDHVKC